MKAKDANIQAFIIFLVGALISALVKDMYFVILFCTLILSCFIDKAGYEESDRR